MLNPNTLKKYLKNDGKSPFGSDKTTQAVMVTTLIISLWKGNQEVIDNTMFQKKCNPDLQVNTLGNWLYNHIPETQNTLNKVYWCTSDKEYDYMLQELHHIIFNENFLKKYSGIDAEGDPMTEDGKFEIIGGI